MAATGRCGAPAARAGRAVAPAAPAGGGAAPAALAVPAEPVALGAALQRLALESPDRATDETVARLARRLWRCWRSQLAGVDRAREVLDGELHAYRRELWLWVMGERRWEPTIAALAGRLARRTMALQPAEQR